jgi:hypothetical protein
VAHNLRSSLDHLAWQLVEANGGAPSDKPGQQTAFPIRDVLPESPTDANLWHLHRLDIIDKHHGPLLASVRHGAVM